MLVLINGLPLFAKKIEQDLNSVDRDVRYIYLNTYYSKWDKIRFFFLMPFATALLSINGVTDRSSSLSWARFWRKKMILQWMGTDCLLAMERFQNNTILRKYIDYAVNFVDSEWQEQEIKSINVVPEKVWFKYIPKSQLIEKYQKLGVLTYVAQSRQEFYGMEKVCQLAVEFPNLSFYVLGVERPDYDCPPNVHLLGWKSSEEVADLMQKTPIYLRLTEHDGFSVSVMEALSYGCEVIWSFEFEYSRYAFSFEEAKLQMTDSIKSIEERDYGPNKHISQRVQAEYGREKILADYKKAIHLALKKKQEKKKFKVLVNGIPLFADNLVEDLKAIDGVNIYKFYNTYYSFWDKIKFVLALPRTDLVISFNGVSDKSGSLDWVLRFRKKMLMQWHGTDVMLAVERLKKGTINRKYIDYAEHFTDSQWLKEELGGIIKELQMLPFKHVHFSKNNVPYNKIKIVSYIGEGCESFYGWEEIVEVARVMSEINFEIIGSEGKGLEKLPNVVFRGWLSKEEVYQVMKESPIFVRLTKHDGNALSVMEALGLGCEVIWSQKAEKVYYAVTAKDLQQKIREVLEIIEKRGRIPSSENYEYIDKHCKKLVVMKNYVNTINEICGKA